MSSCEKWRKVKIIRIVVYDSGFIWDEHFTMEDYKKMEENQFKCPFPKDKVNMRENIGKKGFKKVSNK